MDIKLDTTFTLFQPGRETLDPSYFLLHFVDVSNDEQRFAIVQNEGEARGPLLFRVTEMEAGNPTLGQVQLYAANWQLTVYEQTSATNQDIASAGRKVWSELIGVCEPQDTPAREPYDPCIGCGEGPCPPTTVNATQSDTPTITVVQGGAQVGTLNPATGVHTVPECEECDPQLELRLNDGRVYKTLELECGLQEYVNKVTYPDGTAVGEWNAEEDRIEVPAPVVCSPVTIQLQDSAGNNIGPADIYPSGTNTTKTAPDGTVRWDGQVLTLVRSNGEVDLDCDTLVNAAYAVDGGSVTGAYKPDGTLNGREVFRLDLSHNFEYTGTNWRLVKPGSDYDAAAGSETKPWEADWSATPVTVTQATIGGYCDNCEPADLCELLGAVLPENAQTQILDCVTEATEEAIRVILSPLKFGWGPGDADTLEWEITSDEAGTYGTYTQDGASGTITYSLNGGAFAAVSGTIVLTAGDDIVVRRTSPSLTGFSKWAA